MLLILEADWGVPYDDPAPGGAGAARDGVKAEDLLYDI